MRKRALLLGVFSLGVLSLAGTAHAQGPDRQRERAERIRALHRQILDVEHLGWTRVLQDRGVKPRTRSAVKTRSNVETFAPVTARFLRFNVLATVSGDEPSLDALDLYGPDGTANLTAGEGVRLTASSVWPGHLGDFKDGRYGAGWCWVGTERGRGWLQVELPAPTTISRLVWGRDAQNRYHDRFATVYRVEVSEDGTNWQTVATSEDRVVPGDNQGVSRSALLKALDPTQRKKRHELLAELRKLGAPPPNQVKSGPQVGEGVNGGFASLFLNGEHGHAGKQRCPV
jgi:hypothetical protein